MDLDKETTWKYETVGVEGNITLFGINIFEYPWESTGQSVVIHDPLYGQAYRFSIYTVLVHYQKHTFAAGEFSNCIWGFYVLEEDAINMQQIRGGAQ